MIIIYIENVLFNWKCTSLCVWGWVVSSGGGWVACDPCYIYTCIFMSVYTIPRAAYIEMLYSNHDKLPAAIYIHVYTNNIPE